VLQTTLGNFYIRGQVSSSNGRWAICERRIVTLEYATPELVRKRWNPDAAETGATSTCRLDVKRGVLTSYNSSLWTELDGSR
jgi:hypothetical protein